MYNILSSTLNLCVHFLEAYVYNLLQSVASAVADASGHCRYNC